MALHLLQSTRSPNRGRRFQWRRRRSVPARAWFVRSYASWVFRFIGQKRASVKDHFTGAIFDAAQCSVDNSNEPNASLASGSDAAQHECAVYGSLFGLVC